jgi:hypothetical protein
MKKTTDIDPRSAFLAVESEFGDDDQCIVHGRAYNDIHKGDVLVAARPRRKFESVSRFVVAAISTYGKDVDSLDRMLTGTLVLKGRAADDIKPGVMLLRDV